MAFIVGRTQIRLYLELEIEILVKRKEKVLLGCRTCASREN